MTQVMRTARAGPASRAEAASFSVRIRGAPDMVVVADGGDFESIPGEGYGGGGVGWVVVWV